jgi:type I restriction enzyme M protein
MIDRDNFKEVLQQLGFVPDGNILYKNFPDLDATLKADFNEEKLIYPTDKGFIISGEFTTSFIQKENFVVFECVHRLFQKGYKPSHIELEPKWTVGHGASGGRADIMIKDNSGKSLLIIECKTAGKEFDDEWKKTLINGGQILSYAKQAGSTLFVAVYTSDFVDGTVIPNYYLVTLKDNENLLAELVDKEPLSFEKAKLLDREDIYRAWKVTYEQDFASKGIFENDIRAYEIGKTKYSLEDLNIINSNDIQGKYHQFATILRQHNVSGRENAFDKLVNLFLCKIVDETNNPKELKFYWKGIAYDSFFELQDRLQKLYQEGMKRFLGEEVTYIDNEAIDQAFRFFKNDPDATRETIKRYFRELKFFTNNDFAFIDVHNEKLFYQNATVLLKIVQMLQDIQLKTAEGNQFLGDMFEGFLDQGVKQSEGQFFTPMPIVKFILKSLPLEQIIIASDQVPKAIDFACGAGHFLNEYAQEIKTIVEQYKETEIQKYYENVVGIEKEYRLSKVSKVSAFMYGQDEIKIVYADALATIPTIKDNEYSVLVANPPYSVKGFLETLSEVDRKKYQLLETIGEKSYPNNNSIEAFFIERAKQLLRSDGVAGIIVPSSILTKGKAKSTSKSTNIYVAAREILLKYFDIVSIAEFGSGTFGKTGTNTVTLFLRRKKEDPAPADHYQNRIENWFKGDKTKDSVFEDEYFIREYCNHLELNFEDYKTLLDGKPNKALLEADIFKEYRKEFDKWVEIKNRRNHRAFKALSKEQQKEELEKRFLAYVRGSEKDKLYYFVLASLNPQKVLIVKSPSKGTEIKEFLGYEWSSAKGNEGIKYLGGVAIDEVVGTANEEEGDVALEEEDKRVLSNIFNLNNISTPLYDPKNKNNSEKINCLIAQNFEGKSFEIQEQLNPFVTSANLVDMLDFSRPDFSKSLNLAPRKTNVGIESKWGLQKLGDLVEVRIGGTPSRSNANYFKGNNLWLSISEMNGQVIFDTKEKITEQGIHDSNAKLIPKGTTLLSFKLSIGKTAIAGKDLYTNEAIAGLIPLDKKKVLDLFLFHIFNAKLIDLEGIGLNAFGKSLNSGFLKTEVKIPLPPIAIQKQIIEECQAINKEFEKAEKIIESERAKMAELHSSIYRAGLPLKSIEQLSFEIQYGINDSMNTNGTGYKIFRMNEIMHGYMHDSGEMKYVDIPEDEFKKYRLEIGDILFNRTNSIEHVGKTGLFNLVGDYCYASYLIRIKIDKSKAMPEYVNYLMNSNEFQTYAKSQAAKSINQANINATKMKIIQIPIPDNLKEQEKLVADFKACESKIQKAQDLIDGIAKRKEEVIKRYL